MSSTSAPSLAPLTTDDTVPSASASAFAQSPLIPPTEVCRMLGGISRSTLYNIMNSDPTFPAPLSVTGFYADGQRAGKSVFPRVEVEAWIAAKIAKPRPLAQKRCAKQFA